MPTDWLNEKKKQKQKQHFYAMNTFKTSSEFWDFPLLDRKKYIVNEKNFFNYIRFEITKIQVRIFYPKADISCLY